MARNLVFMLALTSLYIGLAAADWNILNKKVTNGAASFLKSYCESWRINVELNNIKGFEVVPQECVDFTKHYMKSSQYTADSERAIEEARLYLSSCCSLEGDGKDAWIFYVDDTLLSTIPYFKKHGFGGEKLNATLLEAWMKQGKAPALDHTLKLFHEIKDKGVKIFLISSRSETLRSATVDNLINVGYHGWCSLILRYMLSLSLFLSHTIFFFLVSLYNNYRGLEDDLMKVQQYKSEARQRLIKEGYRIWGITGDQWSSVEGLPAAKRTFKLPNSMYYLS
ncbi:acid phosphatase 1-like [Populus alba x Populus x berolinensis]|uniref:Acid phosphatase 1-like n=1 Tax=Populus alba x Populus x berolinensis TaxID=444605 RepID=A0AAD6PZS1_9ROSI|nr:acid phosphatase 1-like [Populus alba x Populus x berolinensis]